MIDWIFTSLTQRSTHQYLGALALSCFTIQAALSESHYTNLFGDTEDNPPVVLSASKLKQSIIRSPASITVIDKQLIEELGARSIVDILYLVPGFQIGRHTNGDPTVTYQGQAIRNNPQLQLLIDGRPTAVPLFGGIPWGELPISVSDIERVEVTRAPNAATFGPNSFSAVVSITTIDPSTAEAVAINSETGGNSFGYLGISHAGNIGIADYRLSLQAEMDEGFQNIPDTEKALVGNFNTNAQLNQFNRLELHLGSVRGSHVEDESVADIYFYPDETISNTYGQIVWEKSSSTDNSFRLQYYYNYHEVENAQLFRFDAFEITGEPTLQGEFVDTYIDKASTATRSELDIVQTLRLSRAHRLAFGSAIRYDTVRSFWLFGDSKTHSYTLARLYAHSEFEISNKFSLNTGFLGEHNTLYGNSVAPRASLHFKINNKNHLRIAYSRGVRAPLPFEQDGLIQYFGESTNGISFTEVTYYNLFPIKPEVADVYDIGFLFFDKELGITFDAKLNYKKVKDRIDISSNTPFEGDTFNGVARYFVNSGESSLKNFEVDLEYRKGNSRFRLGYSRAFGIHFDDPSRAFTTSASRVLDNPPRHTLSFFASHKYRNTTFSAEYYYTSPWQWEDVASFEEDPPSNLNRLDLRISNGFRLGQYNGSISVQSELAIGRNINYLPRNKVKDAYFVKLNIDLP